MKELINIQSELKAPKNQRNTFGGYNYRSAEDILEAVKPILKENNCTLMVSDEIVQIGNRYYIKATATLSNETTSVSTSAFAREEETKKGMDGAQITGSASSYARKYALNGLFLIDDTKDPDATNTHDKETKKVEISLDEVVSEAMKTTSTAEITAIWRKYPQFQKEARFVKIVTDKGNEFKKVKGTV